MEENVGIESAKRNLVEKLVGGSPGLVTVCIAGEEGNGNTTLAKRVFDDEAVTRHFESARAWITVSQPYNLVMVMREIMDQILAVGEADPTRSAFLTGEVIRSVREYLRPKRYVIVFDNVWDERFWNFIKVLMPDNNNGSRVLITTRNEEVVDYCKQIPHHVEILKPWSLPLA